MHSHTRSDVPIRVRKTKARLSDKETKKRLR